ncbi:hypothetical protein OVA11_14115 [Caulobacter sp. SL161]|uniref:hypothetical protein n=1 Tax=Caulobacter sp. SL161 TaxID=2995156 RepID=UPI00227704A5|nr:hypothetical protein [Caulobacter sp. SL161]MCY1648155.1 hypothetical protein [Caulobacter sp. SL161]
MSDIVSVEPCLGVGLSGRAEGYVIICVPTIGAALTVEASRVLRAELEQAEQALLQQAGAAGVSLSVGAA